MRIILAILLLLSTAFTAVAAPLWNPEEGGSLFSNYKAHEVGDILTVIVSENSSASSDAKTDTESSNELEGGAGTGLLEFIPLWGVSQGNKYAGKGKTSRKGALSAVLSVRIIERLPGDQYRVEGVRSVRRNGETEVMTLSGLIRGRDISPQNTILSSAIANAEISYEGNGDVANGNEPGLLTRLLNWFF